MICSGVSVFFFQAEDGIRDDLVTGVQTCALPILVCRWWPVFGCVVCVPAGPQATITPSAVLLTDATWYGVPCQTPTTSMSLGIPGMRSEERRVGKECRSGWSRESSKQNEMMMHSK